MNGGHEQIFGNLNVPTGESRAKLIELGISEEEQGQRLSREAAEKALGKVAVGDQKITVCEHRERQATVREILQANGGSMYWSDLIGVMTEPPYSFLKEKLLWRSSIVLKVLRLIILTSSSPLATARPH